MVVPLAAAAVVEEEEVFARRSRSHQKKNWLVTYGASGPMLDAKTFKEYRETDLTIDECYSTVDRVVKYTLVHFVKKVRRSTMEKFMSHAASTYGIIPTEIFGYAGIISANNTNNKNNNSSNELFMHVGFRMLFKHRNENNPSFVSWIEKPDLRGGGILETYAKKQSSSGGGSTTGPKTTTKRPRKEKSNGTSTKTTSSTTTVVVHTTATTAAATTSTTTTMQEEEELELLTIKRLKTELDQSKQEVSTLTSRLGKAENDVSTLTLELGKAEGDVSTLTSKLGKAEDDVSTLTSKLETSEENFIRTLSTKPMGIIISSSSGVVVEDDDNDDDEPSPLLILATRLMESENMVKQLKDAELEESGYVKMERDNWNATREALDQHCVSLEKKVMYYYYDATTATTTAATTTITSSMLLLLWGGDNNYNNNNHLSLTFR